MSDIILKAENISKQYRLGLVGSRTFQDDLKRVWAKWTNQEDPFLKVGGVNNRTVEATQDYVWAIKNINFEVKRGEVLGIIGKNGAGKSTLLKILSRVTTPSTGAIKSRGRIASLLEVGTGFHPELTGKENIFLNGAILGMSKSEIRSKLDEIIDFSGCAMYIDTPVKRYSSGMRVRLAFAVAAHLEPEILVIDEVLAVGDAEFQKKAIGKMQDISQGEGRTVLFVSHNMAAVKSLCTRAIVLENGTSVFEGTAEECVNYYLLDKTNTEQPSVKVDKDRFHFSHIHILNSNKEQSEALMSGDSGVIRIFYNNPEFLNLRHIHWGFSFYDDYQNLVTGVSSIESGYSFNSNKSSGYFELTINRLNLRGGKYSIRVFSSYMDTKPESFLHVQDNFSVLNVLSGDYWNTGVVNRIGPDMLLNVNISLD